MDEKKIEPRCFGSGEKEKKIHKVDKSVLDLFWTLAEGDDAQRVQAAENLVQRLKTVTEDDEASVSQRNYCLKRLVRGLASSRKFARVGYAVALTKLLREVKDVKVKTVFNTIAEELKVSAHDPKSEIGSKMLGRVFAYGAVIQAERHLKGDQLTTVVMELITLGNKKSYIRPCSTQTLVDLIGRVTPEVLTETVWPHLRDDLDKGWTDCTPDRFILLLACRNKDKSLVDKVYLKTYWGAAKLLGKKNREHLLQLFRRSVETPQLQPDLLEAVTAELTRKVSDIDDLKEFWTKVGSPLLASTVPRKQVALSLFCRLLEKTSNLSLAEGMLFPSVATLICKTVDRKEDPLAAVCAKAESLLVAACKNKDEESRTSLLAVVKGLLSTSHHLKAYSFLRSTTISTLVGNLCGETAEQFSQMCMDCMLGRGDLIPQDAEKEEGASHSDKFSQQLVPLLRTAALNPMNPQSDLTLRVLQFLFLHTFFKVSKATTDIPHCQEVSPDFSPALHGACQATFYRTLTQLLSTKPVGLSQEQQVLKYIRTLSDLVLYVQKLLRSSAVQPVKDISKEVQEEWQTVMEIITAKAGQKKRKSASSQLGESETFTLLILHLAFDLFTEPQATSELLQDIYVCRQKAANKQKAKHEEDGEPEWVEVMTEILLSMLSRASKLARKTTVAVFRSLMSHLTPSALHLVTQVLENDKSKKDELFEFEDMPDKVNGKADDDDDDNDDDGGDDNSEEDSDENRDEEMPTTDEDSDDDEEDDEEEVDEDLRRSVKAALGSAAVASDNDSEEEEDLSDSEMFKLDEQLAAAFRSMKKPTKKEKKEKRREVASFKLRALDLLEVVVRGDRCGDFAIELLEPLLRLVSMKFKGQQGEGQSDKQQLYNRATDLFHSLCKQRNLTDHIHSVDEMLEATNNLLELAKSGSNPQLGGEMANGCLCIMRLMGNQPDSSPSPAKPHPTRGKGKTEVPPPSHDAQNSFVQTVQGALEEDLIHRKNSRFSMAFFSSMVQKYPSVFWPLLNPVRTALQRQDIKVHTKTQACALLVQLVRLNKRDSLSDEQWSSFKAAVPAALTKIVMSQQKDSVKAGLMLEALTALYHISHMSTEEEKKKVLTGEMLSHLAELKTVLNKEARKMHNKLTHLLTKHNHKNKNKRKHQEGNKEQADKDDGSRKKKHKGSVTSNGN